MLQNKISNQITIITKINYFIRMVFKKNTLELQQLICKELQNLFKKIATLPVWLSLQN